MFSAGKDLSIVTWYPPEMASPTSARPAKSPPATREEKKSLRSSQNAGDTQRLSPNTTPPSRTWEDGEGSRVAGGAGGSSAEFTHETEPGFVMHVEEVVGLAAIPGALVSADRSGRLLLRGPDRQIGESGTRDWSLSNVWLCFVDSVQCYAGSVGLLQSSVSRHNR